MVPLKAVPLEDQEAPGAGFGLKRCYQAGLADASLATEQNEA
jgi:hypothetical protein